MLRNLSFVCIIFFILSGCNQAQTASAPLTENTPLNVQMNLVENGLLAFYANFKPNLSKTYTLEERMKHYMTPGVGIAVIDDFSLKWVKGYGVLTRGGSAPVTADTLFNSGSVGKIMTSAAVLKLVEQDILSLDQDVNEVLHSWKVPENEFTAQEKVTIRRLLSHSAGLRDGLSGRSADDPLPNYLAAGDVIPAATIPECLNASPPYDDIEPTRVVEVPGKSYFYSNAGYAILQLVVEDVTGTTFADYMTTNILNQVGMDATTYAHPIPVEFRDQAITEHSPDGAPVSGGRIYFPFSGAGAIWMTPADLARFVIELMLASQGRSEALLPQDMVMEMMTPQIPVKNSPLIDAYALGLKHYMQGQNKILWHDGGTWGSNALVLFYPELGQGAVVMTNCACPGLLRFEILYSIASVYGWPFGK